MTELPNNLATEGVDPRFADLDTRDVAELARVMNDADAGVTDAVAAALPQITAAIEEVSRRFNDGGRIVYLGAGTSGRLGVLDASECPPTYNTRPEQVVGLIAGGEHALRNAAEGAEDSAQLGAADLDGIGVTAADVVVGIAASGRTPYVLGALARAREVGAATVALSCNADAEISAAADLPIEVVVGPEVVAGSTRLRAGTATKLVLNMISTITMIKAGKVFGNRMVDMRASNEKLRTRAARMVSELADVDVAAATETLDRNGWSVKRAVLALLADLGPADAARVLDEHGGRLRDALTARG
ncbi:N-acetylmuramic acid 6-phosphate etherase [Tessaracoccus rhinocerotis]|uniref:N-acetylmuramic acid 6-phosphate etherase n=1 Tax=Tessaracoccus rhinocerotis TaxID=1689449 RepID=A0A553K0Q0_9ACTN|nr:N-acetylmuramic acid 6-phosphate etherase [Tessaracoccus rhinocerotis]TRY18265.1 N-acetylmuramic acid 6-phosphate etherase [Tessaracoccus rhinocerotis]